MVRAVGEQFAGIHAGVNQHQADTGLGVAFFTDPWGTYVELTEGLAGL